MIIFIERFLLAILAAIAVLLAVTNPMGFGVAARIGGVIVIFILAGIAAFFAERIQRNRVRQERAQQERAQQEPERTPPVMEDRIFVSDGITPEYLLSFFHQQLTAVQAANATKDYISKWMKLPGQSMT